MRGLSPLCRLLTLCAFVLLAAVAQAQEHYRAGVLHIKFKKELTNRVAGMRVQQSARGTAITGIASIDQISAIRGVRKFTRIFRESGRYEAAHRAFGLHLWYEIEYDSTFAVGQVMADYEGTDQFEVVEQPRRVQQIGPYAPQVIGPTLPLTTNDPLFDDQWHYENTGQTGGTPGADISLVPAWTIETGSNQVIVAVIDGGIDILHPDLAAAVWVNTDEIPANGVDDDHNGYVDDVNGYGFGDNTGTIHPNFHGTHVAGTIGAVTNNSVGVSGIAGGSGTGNGVRLMSCAGFGLFGTGGFEDAMVYAADNGAVISQNSWGGGSSAIEAAIDYFIARAGLDNSDANFGSNIQTGPMRGGIVIFAAGNSNTDNPSVGYPGSYPPVLAVASTDHNDTRSSFSNYGSWVDIAAPGSSVYSTYPVAEGSYALLSGTSMACPHVSGTAALIISKFKAPGFVPNQVWGRLQETADNIDAQNPAYVGLLGGGRLNAFNALQTDDGVPPAPITDLAVSNEHITSIELTWTATGGSGATGAASFYDLRYSTSPITEANFLSATRDFSSPKPKISGLTEVFEVKGLLPTTTYYFAVKAGDYFGNLSTLSNIASATTPEPPIIGVNPTALSETLYTGGQAYKVLTISNTGASDLIFDISVQSISQSAISGARVGNGKVFSGQRQMSKTQTDAYRKLASWHAGTRSAPVASSARRVPTSAGRIFLLTSPSEIAEINPVNGAVVNSFSTPEAASGGPDGLAFDGHSVYFINSFGSGTIFKLNGSDGSIEKTLNLPGAPSIDALGHSGTYLYALNYGTGTIYEVDVEAGVVLRSITPGVALGGGMSFGGSRSTLFVSNFTGPIHEIDLASGDVVNSIPQTGNIYGLGYSEGAGLLFAQNVYTNSTDAINPETGEIEFSLSSGFSSALASDEGGDQWLTVGEGSLVEAGESIDVMITFDATGLNGGDYLSNILVNSNDPITPLVTVPASLHVDGAPNISLTPETLGFGNVYIGAHPTLTVEVGNNGTDGLAVTGILLTDPGFFIEDGGSTPFTISPEEKRIVTIRFSPVAVGELTGYLYIHSDDPDQPTMAVPLSGTGVTPPVIQVLPSSITSNLYSGQSEEQPMTVHNSGGSSLEVQIDIEFLEPSSMAIQTMRPTPSSHPNNAGVVVAAGAPAYYPQAEGDFTRLTDSPGPLTCFTIDPTSQLMYGQLNYGNQFYRYDPETNAWTSLAPCPVTGGNNGGATYLNGKIYTFYTDMSQMAVYNIASNTWTNTSTPFGTANVTSDGTYLYAVVSNVFKRFNPSTSVWTDLASPPFYFQPWGALVRVNNHLYGHEGNGYTGFAMYSISTNTWTILPSVPDGTVLGGTVDASGKNFYAYGSYWGTNLYQYNIPSATWSVAQIPFFSVNDGGMAFVKKSGKRGVYFLQGESGTGFAKFETSGLDWLQVATTSVELVPGETLDLTAQLDANGLNGGEYSATINFSSNDPLAPLVTVPVSLTVTGAPHLELSPIGMDFGQVFVSGEKSYELTLTNLGTDVLTIASATSDKPQFTVSETVASLLPGESDTVTVTFMPDVAGAFSGQITIQTNDPAQPLAHVWLEGVGITAPIFGVSAGSLISNLFVNEEEERMLTVYNHGGSPLEFDISLTFEEPAGFSSQQASVVKPNASPGRNNYGQMEAVAPQGLFPLAPGDFSLLAPSPVYLTCMTIDPATQTIYARQNQGTGFYTYNVATNAWSNLAPCPFSSGNNGGAVFLNGKIYTVYTETNQMAIYTVSTNTWTTIVAPTYTANIATDGTYIYTVVTNSLFRYNPVGSSWTAMTSPPFYFEAWGALVYYNGFLYGHQGNGTSGFARYAIATNSWTLMPSLPSGAVLGGAIDPYTKKYYTYGSYGGTNMYAFDLTSSTWSTTTIPLFSIHDGGLVHVEKAGKQGIYFIQGELGTNFARFESGGGNWLALETTSGTVAAGGSVDLIVEISAKELVGGEYRATINFNNNDPVTPEFTVPVTLTVTGAPDLVLTPASMNFGQGFIGGEKSIGLIFSNEGTDVLTISSVSSNVSHFVVEQPPTSLDPGELDTVKIIFKPTTVGSFTGTLTVETNDPGNPQIFIDLQGVGIPPPVISITPNSLAETLVAGEKVTRMLTIKNTGSTDLNFGKVVELSSVETWPETPEYGNGKIFPGVKPSSTPTTDIYGNNSTMQAPWASASPQQSPAPAAAGRIFILSGPNTISELSTSNGSIIRSITTPETASGGPDGLAFDGTFLYFTNSFGSQKFYQLNPLTGAVIQERSIPSVQYVDALGHSGTFLYASNYSSGIIYEINFSAGTVVRSITPGLNLYGGMSFGGSRGTIFVTDFASTIKEINLTNGSVIKSIPSTGTIYGLGYSEGTGLLYAQNVSTNAIDAYNPNTGALSHSFSTGFSSALASDEASGSAWLKVGDGSTVAAGQSIEVPVYFDAKGLTPGDYSASIIFESNDPVHPVVTVPITLTVTLPTGLEADQIVDVVLSPNPAHQEVQATYTLSTADQVEFTLTDLTGKIQWTISESRDAGRHTFTASVGALAEGLYLFRLTSREFIATKRLVILRR